MLNTSDNGSTEEDRTNGPSEKRKETNLDDLRPSKVPRKNYVRVQVAAVTENAENHLKTMELLVPITKKCNIKTKPRKEQEARSKLWMYYKKLDHSTALCKECNQVIRTSGNTTNLASHLNKHLRRNSSGLIKDTTQGIYNKYLSFGCEAYVGALQSVNSCLDSDPVNSIKVEKETLKLNDFKFKEFEHIRNNDENVEITNRLLYFICADKLPFSTLYGPGFQSLVSSMAPLYKIPDSDYLKLCLDERFEYMKTQYKQRFATMLDISLSCCLWSEPISNRLFMSIAAHYVHECKLCSVCLNVCELTNNQSVEYIGSQLMDTLLMWNIDKQKIVAVVTDNSREIADAVVKRFGKQRHSLCILDTVNLLVQNMLEYEPVVEVLDRVRGVIKHVNGNPTTIDELHCEQLRAGHTPKILTLDKNNDWKSVYYMLDVFTELHPFFIHIDTMKMPTMPSKYDRNVIDQLLKILKPFVHLTDDILRESYCTVSKVIPMIRCLREKYKSLQFESEILNTFKKRLRIELDLRFADIEMCLNMVMATCLDPRFKTVHFQNIETAPRVRRTLVHKNVPVDQSIADAKYDFWNCHTNLVRCRRPKKKKKNPTPGPEYGEIDQYWMLPIAPLATNPFALWENMKDTMPTVYRQAMKYLSISGTTCHNYAFKQSRYLGKRLSKFAFLACCDQEEWI